jgi:hypothetical protein
MAQSENISVDPNTLTFHEYSQHVTETNQIAAYLSRPDATLTALGYFTSGIVEEAYETFSGSDNPAYARTFLPFAPLDVAKQQRANIDLSFPREVRWQVKEYGDMTWYQEAALQELDMTLRGAVNIAVSVMTDQSVAFSTFAEVDDHIRANPHALKVPNRLKQKGYDSMMGSEPGTLPDFIDCVQSSPVVFGASLKKLIVTLDKLETTTDPHRNQLLASAAEYAGQLLWCNGFILQQRFNTTLSQVVADNIQKTRHRQREGTTFGSGDER